MSVNVYSKTEDKLIPVAGGTVYADNPIGSIIPYGGSQLPAGWYICDGRSLSKNDYFDLWKIIGYNFGGSGSTFNLPDLRNKAVMGGGTLGTSSAGALPNITGGRDNTLSDMVWLGDSISAGAIKHGTALTQYQLPSGGALGSFAPLLFDASESSNLYKNNQSYVEPANVRLNFIIKVKHTPVPADFMDAVEEAIDTSNIAKMLPYSFNKSSNIGAFNRQFVYQGHALTWTATHTGRLTLRLLKNGDGYSLYFYNNTTNTLMDAYDNFFGTDSQSAGCTQTSITLQGWVRKGDSIRLESNLPSSTALDHTFFCQTGLLTYNNNYD